MDDVRQNPMTYFLAALWILVYLGMTAFQGGFLVGDGLLSLGQIKVDSALRFGALSARDVASGQVWRTVTATFVHFSLLHMVLNMTCLISFGRVLESWYGSPQFLALYVAIAAVGNSLAVAGRYAVGTYLAAPPQGISPFIDVTCAGGSSVMFGFIAMMAVVGWRSKTRFGDYVRREMTGKLIFYGLIVGIAGRGILDNYGHGGGALAGAALGFIHRLLLRWEERRSFARFLGVSALVVLMGCAIAQYRSPHREAEPSVVLDQPSVVALCVVEANRGFEAIVVSHKTETVRTKPPKEFQTMIEKSLELLDRILPSHFAGSDQARYLRWRELVRVGLKRYPTPEEIHDFYQVAPPLLRDLEQEVQRARKASPGKPR